MISSISLSSIDELKFFMFLMIVLFDLNIGPKVLPIKNPKFDAALYPIIRKIVNKIIITKNSKK